MRFCSLIFLTAVLFAQTPKGPPSFEPGDTEGLKISPNPAIRHAWKRKVFWQISSNSSRGTFGKIPAQTAAERQQMTKTLDSIVALFKATPTGTNGTGFWVTDSRTLDYFDPFALPGHIPLARFPLQFETGLFPFYHEDIFDKGQWKLSVAGETESVYYYCNWLPGAVGQPVIASEDRGRDLAPFDFYLRPRVTGKLGGLPVYENTVLVVARAGRDPWAPVPLGRALKAALAHYEKDRKSAEDRLANLKKTNSEVQSPDWERQFRERFEKNNGALREKNPGNYQARFRSMEREIAYTREKAAAEANPPRDDKGAWYWNPIEAYEDASRRLAGLSSADAARPSCFLAAKQGRPSDGRYAIRGSIVAAGSSPDCRELALTNWDYYDLKLPRTAPQILSVVDFGRCAKLDGERIVSEPLRRFDHPAQGCVQHAQMWRELDWTKFAAIVVP